MKISSSTHLSRSCSVTAVALLSLLNSSGHAQRLPDTVRPEHYTLALTPDLKAATFSGLESIDVMLKEPTSAITLNSAEIEFQSVEIRANGMRQTATISSDKDKEQTTFTVAKQLPAGKATIDIRYTGILNSKLRGFYLSKTARRNYAVTQFESTDARRAFPSFDEPAFKATYDIALTVDTNDTVISNSSIATDTAGPESGKHTLKFLPTPKMSTYLVAFLVGDFKCTAGEQDGVAIRVCSTPDKVDLTSYGVDVAKYVLHYYNNYFGIPYPLKKLDLIGLPDFEAGAMENFGAITYRETDLLLDPKTASVGAKKEVASVIAHEMAHQWFGDLVTMQWWNNVWLNEGFATWMENKPLETMHPEWNTDQSVIAEHDNTLNLDAQPTTRAIRAKADTREEIEQMFDGISYGKASDVLLMVENYLGEETFRKGVHNYLAAHLYGNATAEDFWDAQTATSHKPVDKIMESFVAQPGVPILKLDQPANGKVDISQQRFFLSSSIQPDTSQKWTLPVCFKTASGQDCQLLTPESSSLEIPSSSILFANAGGKGYYFTGYPDAVYKSLVSQVETGLAPTERISLIGDEWAQLRANKTAVGDYLDLISAVKSDSSATVVDSGIEGVDTIFERVAATPDERNQLAAWIRKTFAPEFAKLGSPKEDDSANTRELRAALFGVLGFYGKDPAVLAQAKEITQQYLANPGAVDATLGHTALAIAAQNGDAALFGQVQHLYETSNDPEVQEGALRLLPEFENPALVDRSLDYAASNKVRNQDAAIQFAIGMRNDASREQTWKYIKEHWDTISTLMTPELGSALVGSTASFCSADARDDAQQFFTAHKVASADQALKHSIERINGCIEFRKLQEPNLEHWLKSQSGK